MRRGRIFFYLAFIIILGLAAVLLIWTRMPSLFGISSPSDLTTAQPTPVSNVNVVVVSQKIARGSSISADKLELIPIPQDLFYEGMFTNIGDVEGRLAKFDLEAGVPMTIGMLAENAEQLSDTGSIAALSIPRGMVAVSVPISRLSSVSYAPRAGDHVNVIVTLMFVDLDPDFQSKLPNRNIGVLGPGTGIGNLTGSSGTSQGGEEAGNAAQDTGGTSAEIQTSALVAVSGGGGGVVGRATADPVLAQTFYQIPNEDQRPRLVSQNLLQDAVVLQMGSFAFDDSQTSEPTPVPDQAAQEGEQAPQTPLPPDVITLIVSPQDAITLNYLLYSGAQLTLALRAAEDDTRVQTESVTLQFLLEQYNITVPAKLPTGVEPATRVLVPPVLKNDLVPTQTP